MKQTTRHRPMASMLACVATVLIASSILFASAVHAIPSPSPTPLPAPTPLPLPGVIAGIDDPTTTAYSDEVCKPPTVHPSDPLPPCVDIENIETLCYPNGTAPLYLAAHAQCMCRGSYFSEWNACRRCLSVHGQLSDRDFAFYESVASAASTSLCGFLGGGASGQQPTTTPTAIFRDLFTSAEARLTASPSWAAETAAETLGSDAAPNNTDVGVYFTASGPEGPGSITGSATAATATGLALATGRPPLPPGAPGASTSGSGMTGTAGTATATATMSGSSSHSGSVESAATRIRGLAAMLVVVLGGSLFL
ncbi:hypothetical protein SCUCBS95973_004602 [Sporothrix curviconia]|uniref:Collagen-like protein mcl1 n=1 Tax=Sporothrix curviconia TaxID=1260050 RepID=A0ABP0BQ16_9PEZI